MSPIEKMIKEKGIDYVQNLVQELLEASKKHDIEKMSNIIDEMERFGPRPAKYNKTKFI